MERRSATDLAIILDQQETIAQLQSEVAHLEQLLWQATEFFDPIEECTMSIH